MNLADITDNHATYIVAVSGGVDSISLLHSLINRFPSNTYIVAHVNHGIRPDAHEDEALVKDVAEQYGLNIHTIQLELGTEASEALARDTRYAYLRRLQKDNNATAIITAHHQDDVIETCFINLVRGTGRKGMISLATTTDVVRPLLHVPKKEIYAYAHANNLLWREDSTNIDTTILRNKIRHHVVPRMSDEQRLTLLRSIDDTRQLQLQIQKEISNLLYKGLHKSQPVLNRRWFAQLPHDIASEVIYTLLIQNGAKDIDRSSVERVVVGIKTLPGGKTLQVSGVDVKLTKRSARFYNRSQTEEKSV